jgi:hypothetical protein
MEYWKQRKTKRENDRNQETEKMKGIKERKRERKEEMNKETEILG